MQAALSLTTLLTRTQGTHLFVRLVGKKKKKTHFILFGFKDQLVISKTKSFSQGKIWLPGHAEVAEGQMSAL